MELRNELIRPSRNKHRSNAVAAMRLLDRRETVTQLEQQLRAARTQLLLEEEASQEKRKAIMEKKEQLEREELQSLQLFQANGKIRESTTLALNHDLEECRKLDEEQRRRLVQMEELERDLNELTARLEFLQNYQNTISDVEGFDRVVSKFQELNQTWQNTASEYRAILIDATRTSFRKGHPTEFRMQCLVEMNFNDRQIATELCEATNRNKRARNAQWQICTVTESFKQHGQIYLSILNLASHLSSHPIARTLMNIGDKASIKPKANRTRSRSIVGKKDDLERVPSVEQIISVGVSKSYKERWKSLAAAAVSDGRGQPRGGTDVSLSSDIGRTTDSISIEIQQKLNNLSFNDASATQSGHKQSVVNKVAASKLNFIEQILYDLTLIKDEIEFQTDPIHYNEPGHSFA